MLKDKVTKEILSDPYCQLFGNMKITLSKNADGFLHRSSYDSECGSSWYQGEKKVFLISELIKHEELCEFCFKADSLGGALSHIPLYRTLANILGTKAYFKRKPRNLSKVSPSVIQTRIKEVKRKLQILDRVAQRNPELGSLIEEIKGIGEEALTFYFQASSDEKIKAQLEKIVQQELLPKKYKAQNFKFDSTPVLIGISPTPKNDGNLDERLNTVLAVIDAYSIRKDKNAVLYAPAYFHSYLLNGLLFKAEVGALVISAPAPESAEARDNGAHLWDPDSEGVLACLAVAVESGMALSDKI